MTSFPRRLAPMLVAGPALLVALLLVASGMSAATQTLLPLAASASPFPSVSGRLVRLAISSPALGVSRAAVIYLPPGYDDPVNGGRRYPVLYLLSGAPGTAEDWFRHMHVAQTADRLIAAGAVPPLILVSPDGNGGPHRDSQFLDSADGHQLVERFLVRDVLGYVDTHFRTVPARDGRGLVGYSAGAYGALNVGLHHPELFGALAGFCGYYTADLREVAHPDGAFSAVLAVGNLLGALALARHLDSGRRLLAMGALGFFVQTAWGLAAGYVGGWLGWGVGLGLAPVEAWMIWFLLQPAVRAHMRAARAGLDDRRRPAGASGVTA